VGFNHMVSSAPDNAALVMETNGQYTAYFSANDPRCGRCTRPIRSV
jgi:hypothetical protein